MLLGPLVLPSVQLDGARSV